MYSIVEITSIIGATNLCKRRRVKGKGSVQLPHRQPLISGVAEKIDATRKVFAAAKKKAEEHSANVVEAQTALTRAKENRATLRKKLDNESKQLDVTLNAEQLADYRRLKAEAAASSTMIATSLYNLQQKQQTDSNIVEHEQRRLQQYNERIREKRAELEREQRNIEAMREGIERTKQRVAKEKDDLKDAEREVCAFKEKLKELNDKLNDVVRRLADTQGENNETHRDQARREALENLKRVFPDKVFGCLFDLVQPSNKRYQVAVTKILNKHLNSIVVSAMRSARSALHGTAMRRRRL